MENPKHRHKISHTVEVCECGAYRHPEYPEYGWIQPTGLQAYLENSTPEERKANAAKGGKARWRGRHKETKTAYMRKIASRPRPSRRIPDRCNCGKFSKTLAAKRGHKC